MTLNSSYILNSRYRIVKLVGQGGFGAVYRAWDISLHMPVAVKENLDTSLEAQRQFEQEALLLAPLRHPNLPRVSDHFVIPDQGQYLVMDFIEGKSLDAIMAERGGPLSEGEALNWIGQVCDALEYLHSRRPPIIHRDIKPQNIIITADGRAVLVDFGISKAYDPSLTTTRGARAVTPGYSPPEQYGMGKTDARSDVYALGATLYTLLTFKPPPESVALLSGGEQLVPVRQVNPGVKPTTEQAIAQAMALSISYRLAGVHALREALAGRPVAGSVPTPVPAAKNRPALLWAGLAGVVVIAAAVALYLFLRDGDSAPEPTGEPGETWIAGGIDDESVAAAGPPVSPVATLLVADTDPGAAVAVDPAAAIEAVPPTAPAATATATPIPTSPPPPAAGDRRLLPLPGGAEMPQVFVPAGDFLMGSDTEDSDTDEVPVHEVRLDAFWIGETEVTNAQFAAFVADMGYVTTDERDGDGYSVLGNTFELVPGANWRQPFGQDRGSRRGNDPVVLVSWADADAFCRWAGGRLPSEAEWEYAARGPSGSTFPWGDAFSATDVNYCDRNCPLRWADDAEDDTFAFMAPAGSFGGNESWIGALDMAGDDWEWPGEWEDRGT